MRGISTKFFGWGSDKKSGPILHGEFDNPRNFRDIAGDVTGKGPVGRITTTEGMKLVQGLAYRSSRISAPSKYAFSRIQSANITRIVDLRFELERTEQPDRILPGATYQVADVLGSSGGWRPDERLHEILSPEVIDAVTAMSTGTYDPMTTGLAIAYAATAVSPQAHRAFRDLLIALAYNQGAVLFHCTAGKDRTGFGAALLLRILGVPLATIEEDYLASNYYLRIADTVKAKYLQTAWDTIDLVFGGFDSYVSNALGLKESDIHALKKKFLTRQKELPLL